MSASVVLSDGVSASRENSGMIAHEPLSIQVPCASKIARSNKSFLDQGALLETIVRALNGESETSQNASELYCSEKVFKKAQAHTQRFIKETFHYESTVVHRELLAIAQAEEERRGKGDEKRAPVSATLAKHSGAESIIPVKREFCTELYKSNLPNAVDQALASWRTLSSKIVHIMESGDYVTTKLLIELASGQQVEAVLLRHNRRTTLCVSSQVGCKMGCTFCATGTLGQRANLSSGEILEQLFHANRFLKTAGEPRDVTNVVFMGMGEPLNNYDALVAACQAMTNSARFCLSPSRITVSTVGVTNRMRTLHRDVPGVSLALSLHAPNQELRQKIIPTAGAYPVEKLMDALKGYLRERHESAPNKDAYVMIEYILLSGVNDTVEVAEELAQLLEPIKAQVKVNLIPYNPIFNAEGLAKTFVPPTEHDIEQFKNTIQIKYGIFCTVRTEMGQDVNGACGQLACVSEDAKTAQVDIEDLYTNRAQNKLYNEQTGENVMRTNVVKSKQRKEQIEAIKPKAEEAKIEQDQLAEKERQERLERKAAKAARKGTKNSLSEAAVVQKTLPPWGPTLTAATVLAAATAAGCCYNYVIETLRIDFSD